MIEPRYPIVLVEVAEADAEEAGAHLFELGALGVEQRDATTLLRSPSGRVVLVASFSNDDDARAAVAAAPPAWSPRASAVVGDGWRDEWKKHFEPFVLCRASGARARAVVVRPPWRAYDPSPGDAVIVLEPGRAFGTGLHETTRLVAEVLADRAATLAESAVLDVGCGSGILALTAVALGATGARAIDVDPDAVAAARENAERNGWADCIHVDDARASALTAQYGLVLANIEAHPLIGLAPALEARVAPGGVLVLSGILAPDVAAQWDDVRRAYAGFGVREIRQRGEWIAAVLERA
ncbi:MAG: 50S ribosomal protein L11 methyltransferase [Polyangiaceae bacterium]|nr:50S ribosomal protein L11 methyltransferase [Polyangiaceae bacterium]